jgi:hypothetical protein
VQPSESRFRLIKSITGSKGEEQAGRFVIQDPRTIFYLPDDKKVIAYFEWDGPLGPHHFEALWKNPEGKVVIVSDFKYEAKQKRFAGYWQLLLSDTVATGVWTVESRIDGEAAGTHNFQIISSVKPSIAEDTRRLLTVAELYKKATAATVRVENLNDRGQVQREGLGFFVDDGALLAPFQVIDGASRIRIVPSVGQPYETDQLIALERWEDWATLRPPASASQERFVRAKPGSWSVGDHCTTLNINEAGATLIVDGQISGIQKQPRAGERLAIVSSLDRKATGAPLMNEYGEVVGMMAGVPFPGAFSSNEMVYSQAGFKLNPFPTAAVPISQIRTTGTPSPLAQWASAGHFMPVVVPVVRVSRGGIAKKVQMTNGFPDTQDERVIFKRADRMITAYVMWDPQKKHKGIGTFRLFGSNNNLMMESKPSKLSFDPSNRFSTSTWNIPLAQLPDDLYRLDLRLDADTIWRAFFRVTD